MTRYLTASRSRRCWVCRASLVADADASSSTKASNPADGRHTPGTLQRVRLTGDVNGELQPAQNTAFWVVFVVTPYKPRAEDSGGSARGYQELPAPLAILGTAEHGTADRMFMHSQRWA